MNFGFSDLSRFLKDLLGSRNEDLRNRVKVMYLDDSNNLQMYPGRYVASLDCVEVPALRRTVYLNKKGTYYDPESKQKLVIASYNRASSLRPDQSEQDYMTGENVESILKAGLFDRVIRPNMTLGVIGFVLGISVTGFCIALIMFVGMIL